MICSTLVLNRTLKLEHIDSVIIVTSQNHMQRSLALAKALLPRKLHISGFPSYHKETKEEWLALEKNREIQDKCIQLLKGLVDTRIVEDMEVNIEL